MVFQLASEDEVSTLHATSDLLKEKESLSAWELARLSNIAPLLAKERLLAAEQAALACRDDSEQGLRFYPNLFATRD
ncbi:unnamed protein product [Protopolystoma xenopodis]|uniref:Vacuolar protein-sorting-associated protein 36 n=1 Tax=Protopolystoma xenopodis TaxID=117903 RepID=A0A448WF55_9PLAT|nr:unnamed protein product [Protopolystoma xenopodis]